MLLKPGRRCPTLSSRHLLPGSIIPLAPALADGWIPVTSTGMTAECYCGERR
jgi:hypothetical protein